MTHALRARRAWPLVVAVIVLLSSCGPGRADPLPFNDTFDNPQSGWGSESSGAFDRQYDGGVYAFTLRRQDWLVWAHAGHTFGDVAVEADVNAGAGQKPGLAGVMCRHRNLGNFYFFAITSDGYYAIFRRVRNGALEALTGAGSLEYSDAIAQGNVPNHLLAICQGQELSFSINGELVASAADASIARGDVGIGAASGPSGQVRVEFDNLLAYSP